MMGYVLAFTFGIMVGWVLCERQLEEEFWTDVDDADGTNDVYGRIPVEGMDYWTTTDIKPDDDFNDVM